MDIHQPRKEAIHEDMRATLSNTVEATEVLVGTTLLGLEAKTAEVKDDFLEGLGIARRDFKTRRKSKSGTPASLATILP
jgi:hypothetical protein